MVVDRIRDLLFTRLKNLGYHLIRVKIINVNNKKLSFTKDINKDNKILEFQKYTKLKKGKGKVVLIKNKKYVELNNKYYDYNSYINSGILQPV